MKEFAHKLVIETVQTNFIIDHYKNGKRIYHLQTGTITYETIFFRHQKL